MRARTVLVCQGNGPTAPCAIDFTVGLLPGGAVTQPGNDFVVGATALAIAAGLERGVEVRVERGSCSRGQHADDGIRLALQLDCLPNETAVLVKASAPQVEAQDCRLWPVWTVFSI